MNQLSNVFNYQDQMQVRTISINEQPYFVAKDVCDVLDISDVRRAVERLEEDERILTPLVDSLGKSQEMYVVNEYGLYSLVLGSRKKQAKEFKRWITHEVIPSIRKHGFYMTTTDVQVPELLEKVNKLENKIESFITITSYEARIIQKAIGRRVYTLVNEPDQRGTSFQELHREIRDRFGVPSYRDLPKNDFQTTLLYINAWIPKKTA